MNRRGVSSSPIRTKQEEIEERCRGKKIQKWVKADQEAYQAFLESWGEIQLRILLSQIVGTDRNCMTNISEKNVFQAKLANVILLAIRSGEMAVVFADRIIYSMWFRLGFSSDGYLKSSHVLCNTIKLYSFSAFAWLYLGWPSASSGWSGPISTRPKFT